VEQLEDRTLLSGTPRLLADINPGAPSSNPTDFVVIGSTTYFAANDGAHGDELWKSDGTAAGTRMVADINPGSAGSYPTYLTNVNGTLYFTADDVTHGARLWKSDGTPDGTVPVANVGAKDLTNVNGELFFACGSSLWKSDGTAAGTVQVSNAVSNPQHLTNVNGELFFSGYDSTNGTELWKSDGTAAGTVLVKDIYPGFTGIGYWPYSYALHSAEGSGHFPRITVPPNVVR
jgi:ELWxxDGT repeat protein